MLKKIKVFVFLLLVGSSSGAFCSCSSGDKMSYIITGKFAKNAKEKYGIKCVAVGGSEKDGKQSYIKVHFHTDQLLTIDSGRLMALKLVNEFLSMINCDKKFRKYLIQYPFTPENVGVILGGSKSIEYKDHYIDFLSASKGFITYFHDEAKDNGFVVFKERFKEAECKSYVIDSCILAIL